MGDAADDAERRAQDELENDGTTVETEIRPEELTYVAENPLWASTLPAEAVEALRQPLDPNRVRSRQGRGQGKFEYLAGHDVKRRANEIFGFGNWGAELVELTELASVPVQHSNGKDGWHVGYSAIMRVTVRGCLPVSDVGYGDGVEYGPAAHVTARELAMKEAATDAMKRALTQYGDQFGLILYAKDDEKKRIDREANRGATEREVRQNVRVNIPRTWAEVATWAEPYGESLGWNVWVAQASMALYGTDTSSELTTPQRSVLLQKACGAIVALREEIDPSLIPGPTRADVQKAWAGVIDNVVLNGPEWRMSPDEEDREPYKKLTAEEAAAV